jgi:hypothetical protein
MTEHDVAGVWRGFGGNGDGVGVKLNRSCLALLSPLHDDKEMFLDVKMQPFRQRR